MNKTRLRSIVKRWGHIATLCVAPAISAFPFQSSSPTTVETVNSIQPLLDVAEMLQSRYGRIVTYEETIIVYRPDLAVYGKDENVKWTLGPRRRLFTLVPIAGLWKASTLDGPLLSSVIEAYNQQNDGLRFRTEESKYGLHIIPARSRDERGQDVAVSPLLDAPITVPVERRLPLASFEALCQAVGQVTGIRLEANTPILGYGLDHMFSGAGAGAGAGAGDPYVTWGVGIPTTARAALIDLLGHSASSLSWHLNCQASARPEDRFCVLNITPVVLDVTDRNGKWVKKPLAFDRCVVCPKVIPPPPGSPPE